MKQVLVTGGCGYIGSHTIVDLVEAGYEAISVDNFSNSSPKTLDRIHRITGTRVGNHDVDLCDRKATEDIFAAHPDIAAIIHFAAHKAVGESVQMPFKYFRNNLMSLINVAECARKYAVPCFVYSSSCTVYGIPDDLPVTEATPVKPAESPYGRTKQMGEQILEDGFRETSTRAIALRYFNPAGAHPSGEMGESPLAVGANLVPAITETAIGLRPVIEVFGDDYDTRDGTCIRDYIHIMDLARAHRLAMETSWEGKLTAGIEYLNLGIGEGVTVLEAIKAFEAVSGKALNYRITDRRPGDVPAIYSDYSRARNVLGWEPEFTIQDIMRTAWAWEQRRRSGTMV
ncbi:MAG: UDP-glucose 4-epimerase GalE [Saprospiraceae bacterium]|nr:UDP-glucose 4-epimerase GalE [Saprospiraceae bacterium]